MRLFFIRHTKPNVAPDIAYGQLDVDVCESFYEEALKTKSDIDKLMELCTISKFVKIYSSPLKRAAKLARRINESFQLPIEYNESIRETALGSWEGLHFKDIQYPLLYMWENDYLKVKTKAETTLQMFNRVFRFIEHIIEIHSEDDNILIFTHGGPILAAGVYFNRWKADRFLLRDHLPEPGLVTTFNFNKDSIYANRGNDVRGKV